MNNNKKKITTVVLLLAFLAIAVTGGTLAYFTDSEKAENIVTIGNVDVKLYESKYHRGATGDSYLKMTGQPEPLDDATIVADDATYKTEYLAKARLMPFDLKTSHRVQSMFEECTVAKNAYVQNVSTTNDCFVRVSYIVPASIAPYLDIFYTDTQFIENTDATATADARTLNNTDKIEPMITDMDSNAANFVAQGAKPITEGGKDYYVAEFIYAERLTPGEFTLYSPISKVTLIPTVNNETAELIAGADRQFDVQVKVEAIQADGFYNALEAFASVTTFEHVGV